MGYAFVLVKSLRLMKPYVPKWPKPEISVADLRGTMFASGLQGDMDDIDMEFKQRVLEHLRIRAEEASWLRWNSGSSLSSKHSQTLLFCVPGWISS